MSTGASFQQFEAELSRLVASFGQRLAELKNPSYVEAQLRDDFLNPFFRALGWDMENRAGLIQSHREVEIESRAGDGRADYLFRPERKPRFVCEAKKPAEELHGEFAMQAKRYAWTIGLRLAVLSDFEELKVYVVRGNPDKGEDPDDGLWLSFHFTDYAAKARELWDLLARDSVAAGSVERLIESLPRKLRPVRTRDFDEEFLAFLDGHRRALASDLIRHNDREDLLEGTRLNDAVQNILDRLLFIRISEARGIDMGTKLHSLLETWKNRQKKRDEADAAHEEPPAGWGGAGLGAPRGSLWNSIVRHIRALDRRPPSHVPFFNGNLFKPHFSEELVVGDVWLSGFLTDIGEEKSSYKFGYVPVEILGTIYERFLGKVVRPHGRGAVIEEKPEVRKAGGVYYTPRYVVEYIVEQTVGKMLAGRKPEDTLKLRFLDPACGSGSFLLRVFERVCEHWQQWLMEHPDQRKKDWCWLDVKTNTLHLTVRTKRRILRETVFGVDLDAQAVEVTQLSLYLKMLEGETSVTLHREQDLFGGDEAILPPLQDNIKCGNSLIASDFSMMPEDLVRVHAFDWPVQFQAVMRAGGFDAVVGNPPYIRIQGFPEDQIAYFGHNYRAATGNYDIYVNFAERGLNLLSKTGRLGMILPNKFLRTDYGVGLRTLLSEQRAVTQIVDFGAEQVFEATTYTCLLFLSRSANGALSFAMSKADVKCLDAITFEQRPSISLTSDAWTFANKTQARLLEKLKAASIRLLDLPADMSRGSSSGDDQVFVVEASGHGLENDILRTPLFASDFGRYHFTPQDKWRILFPYVAEKGGFRLMQGAELQKMSPKAFSHLQQNAVRLKERKQFKEWFGYSAPRNLELHDRAQIAVPLLADGGLFALIPKTSRGTLCPMASGGFTVTLGADCALKPEFVLGILNSKLSFWFLRQISNVFRGGWITCTKQYFGELPIVRLDLKKPADKARHDKLVVLVEKMLGLMPKLRAAASESEKATLQNAVTATDQQIDQLVYELYGLTEDEIKLVESGQ